MSGEYRGATGDGRGTLLPDRSRRRDW